MSIEINGTASDGWEPLIDQFASNFDRYSELGASVCVTYEGETVVDVWAGDRDTEGNPCLLYTSPSPRD